VYGGLRQLTALHFQPVVGQLLDTSVPLAKEYVDAYTALVADQATPLPQQFVEHLCALLNDTPIDKDKPAVVVSVATSALKEIAKVEAVKPLMQAQYAAVICTLLMRVGMCNDVDSAGTGEAIAALRAFFTCVGDVGLLAELDAADVFKGLTTPQYDDSVTLICRALCTYHPPALRPAILAYLGKFFSQQSYTGQRIVATSMLAELVTHSSGTAGESGSLLRDVIKSLLPRVADKKPKVRHTAPHPPCCSL
jgi:hypothetical protein